MSERAAFRACYSDWKLIRTRKCVQLVFEVPLEESDKAYAALGGMPNSGEESWVAIARLNPETERTVIENNEAGLSEARSVSTRSNTPPASGPDIQARARKPVAVEKKIAQRVGILCHDKQFQTFLNAVILPPISTMACVTNEEEAADVVRYLCSVKSRSEITPGSAAADKWDGLYSKFIGWRDAPVYVEEPTDA